MVCSICFSSTSTFQVFLNLKPGCSSEKSPVKKVQKVWKHKGNVLQIKYVYIRAVMSNGSNIGYAKNVSLLILYKYLHIIQPKFLFPFFQESLIPTCRLGERKVQSQLVSVIFVARTRKNGNDTSNLQNIFDSLEISCWMLLVHNFLYF